MDGKEANPVRAAGTRSFEEAALGQGLVTAEQLEECRRIQRNVLAQGLSCDLEEVLLKKGLVTKAQAMAIHAALGRGTKGAIEGYEILGKIGAGGQGAVYKARQSSLDRFVAIKVLLPKYAKEKDGVERFLREARAIARLNHPNIVRGIDAGYSNGIYYYVMEYVEGEGLDKRLAGRGKLPWREAVSLVRQVASALDHAHRNGLVHRDVKPGNILLAKDGTAKLLDLGMARFAGEVGMTLTQTGFVVGTPFYIAPEQARGEREIDIRVDLYALGITLYEMLAGRPPFRGTDPLVVLNQHLHETVRFAFPDVPAELLAIGHHLTERERSRRYATPAELLEDLDALDQRRPLVHAAEAVRRKTARQAVRGAARPSSRVLLLIAGAAVAAIIGALALIGKGTPPQTSVVAQRKDPAAPTPSADRGAEKQGKLTEPERTALAALARARQYEADNPNDLEEIAARYADLAAKTAGTAEADTVRRRAEESKAELAAAVGKRKAALRDEVQSNARSRRFGAALEGLDRHARDYKSPEWREWIASERSQIEASLAAETKALREASAAAESKGDYAGAIAPLLAIKAFEVPAPSTEASERIQALETARRAAEAELARKAGADRSKLESFLDRADALAAERSYEKIEALAPVLETEEAKQSLESCLARYRGAREILEVASQHALRLQGKPVTFVMANGAAVSGRVEAVQERPPCLLVGGRTYDVRGFSVGSVVAFYRAARGEAAKDESILFLAILEGSAGIAEETLKKNPLELPTRYRDRLHKAAAEAQRAQAEREAARAKKEESAPAKKPEAAPREVILYASDLPRSALSDEFEFWDDAAAQGGKMIGIRNQGDKKDPPPDADACATFKVQVQAGVPYRCWIRMKVGRAQGRSQANLLYVQFTSAADKTNKEIYTLGTRDYLTVRGGTKEGWAWVGRDSADPKSTEPTIYFRTTGEITVRISAGMEGVGFDQFVLSPAQYFAKPPAEAVVARPKR